MGRLAEYQRRIKLATRGKATCLVGTLIYWGGHTHELVRIEGDTAVFFQRDYERLRRYLLIHEMHTHQNVYYLPPRRSVMLTTLVSVVFGRRQHAVQSCVLAFLGVEWTPPAKRKRSYRVQPSRACKRLKAVYR
jgi:hypothetical protein